MRRRSVRTSAGRQDSSTGPSSSLYVLLDDTSATDNERAGQEDESHSTSSEPQDFPADNPPDEKPRRFQCDQCSKSYAHNKDLAVSYLPSEYPYYEMVTRSKRHKKTSVCATTQRSDVFRNAAPSRMLTATSVAHVSVPVLVKMYQCPRCKGDFSIKFSAQVCLLSHSNYWPCTDPCCSAILRKPAGKYAMSAAPLGTITATPTKPTEQTNSSVQHAIARESSARS
jgi:hypothetical protein